MNLPNSVVRHVFPLVSLIFRRMAYVPHRFPNNCNDRRLTEFQRLRRASVKRKSCGSPTKNGCANLTPLRLCRYFTDNDAGLVTSCIGVGAVCQPWLVTDEPSSLLTCKRCRAKPNRLRSYRL